MELQRYFKELRFDPKHHLGLGDIRLTIAQQDKIVADVEKMVEKKNETIGTLNMTIHNLMAANDKQDRKIVTLTNKVNRQNMTIADLEASRRALSDANTRFREALECLAGNQIAQDALGEAK